MEELSYHGCLQRNLARVMNILCFITLLPELRECFLDVVDALQCMICTFNSM